MCALPLLSRSLQDFTGKLTLAEVNGPSDGMALCMLFSSFGFFFPGIYHQSYGQVMPLLFKGTIAADLPFNTFPIIIGYVGIVATLGGKSVAHAARAKHSATVGQTVEEARLGALWLAHLFSSDPGVSPLLFLALALSFFQVSKKVTSWGRPLSKLLPFLLMTVLAWSWVLLQPAFFGAHARVFCFSLGFLFCQMICSLMIAHVCHADYAVRRPVLLPLVGAWVNCVGGPLVLPHLFPLVAPDLCLYGLLAFNFGAWFHFIANSILEICELLNIYCFHIVPKEQGHDGSTVQAVNAHAAATAAAREAELARHNGINPISPTTSQALLDSYQVTPSPQPPRATAAKKTNAD